MFSIIPSAVIAVGCGLIAASENQSFYSIVFAESIDCIVVKAIAIILVILNCSKSDDYFSNKVSKDIYLDTTGDNPSRYEDYYGGMDSDRTNKIKASPRNEMIELKETGRPFNNPDVELKEEFNSRPYNVESVNYGADTSQVEKKQDRETYILNPAGYVPQNRRDIQINNEDL